MKVYAVVVVGGDIAVANQVEYETGVLAARHEDPLMLTSLTTA